MAEISAFVFTFHTYSCNSQVYTAKSAKECTQRTLGTNHLLSLYSLPTRMYPYSDLAI